MARIIFAGACDWGVDFEGTETECLARIDELREEGEFEDLALEECFYYTDDTGVCYSIWRSGELERE